VGPALKGRPSDLGHLLDTVGFVLVRLAGLEEFICLEINF
jgi:hypothetical protein